MFDSATTGKIVPEPVWAPVMTIADKYFEVEEKAVLECIDRLEAVYGKLSEQCKQETQKILQEKFSVMQAQLEQIFTDNDNPMPVTNKDKRVQEKITKRTRTTT